MGQRARSSDLSAAGGTGASDLPSEPLAGLTAETLTVVSGVAAGLGRFSSRRAGRKSSAGSGGGSLRGRIETGSLTTGYAPVCSA